jgi:hypothetical protein
MLQPSGCSRLGGKFYLKFIGAGTINNAWAAGIIVFAAFVFEVIRPYVHVLFL